MVTELAPEDFLDFKTFSDGENCSVKNWSVDEHGKRVLWTKLHMLKLRKEDHGHAYYKLDYQDEFKAVKLNPESEHSQRSGLGAG